MARIDCRVEAGLAIGMEDSAGRSSSFVGFAEKESTVGPAGCWRMWEVWSWRRSSREDLGRTGLVDRNYFEANCTARQKTMCPVGCSYPVTACDGRGDRDDDRDARSEDQERTDFVAGRKKSAVHMATHLSRIGCPDRFVQHHCSLEDCCYSSVQVPPDIRAYDVHQQIRVVLRIEMTLVELGRGSPHCCSALRAVLVALAGAVHPQIHAGLAPDMMLVELGLNSHRCLSFARWRNTRSCCSGSAK